MKKLTNTQTKILDAIFEWWDSGYDIEGNFVIYPHPTTLIEDEPVRDESCIGDEPVDQRYDGID